MFQKIAVPLDQSTFAEGALPAAISLAERSGGELHLVTVIPAFPVLAWSGAESNEMGAAAEAARKAARSYLQEVAGRIAEAGHGGPVRTHVLTGTAVQTLQEWTLEERIALIVMTTHGRGRVQRFWLGSVADGLVRRAPCPILLWRRKSDGAPDLASRPSFRRILVPLDGSDRAAAILPHAVGLARLHDAGLSLLAVSQNPPPFASPYTPHLEFDMSAVEVHGKELKKYLEGVQADTREAGVKADADVTEGAVVADQILAHAARQGVDLIALCTRGHGGAARLVLGSVADKVIRGSEVHILAHRDGEVE